MAEDPLIMVIDGAETRAANLKELIEFMDAPRVTIANPENWRERLGERRLGAVFLGADLDKRRIDQVIREIGELDPNTPIVRVAGVDDEEGDNGR